jgi:hypothetical protein
MDWAIGGGAERKTVAARRMHGAAGHGRVVRVGGVRDRAQGERQHERREQGSQSVWRAK